MSVITIVITVLFVYFITMVPLQYFYIKELKKAQAANAVTSLIYQIQHGKDPKQ